MSKETLIRKVSKGISQNRVTIPKSLKADYVGIIPIELPNILKEARKNAKK